MLNYLRIGLICFFACGTLTSLGCTGSQKGAVAPKEYADFPGEDSRDGGGGRAAPRNVEPDNLEEAGEN
jgi:hypothetical protein